jgi:hypothetical protein
MKIKVLAAGLVVLTTAGCFKPSPAEDASGSPKPSAPNLLKGSKLNTLLLPASAMPKGFHISAEGARNSAEAVAPASKEPLPPGKVCEVFTQTAWIRAGGVANATFAQNDYVDAGRTNQVAQELDGFHGDDAQAAMAGLRKSLAGCAHYTQKSNGMVAKVKIVHSALKNTGDEAIKAVETSPVWEGGMTLVAVRVGTTVITVFYSSSHADKGAAAVKMARQLADNVSEAS